MIQVFKERNKNNFSPELLNKISMKDLFKGNMATFLNANESKLDTLPPFSRIPPLSSQMMPPQLYDANNLSKLMSNQIYPPQSFQPQMPTGPTPIQGMPENYLLKRPEIKQEKSHKLFNTSNVDKVQSPNPMPPFQSLPNDNNRELLQNTRKRYIKNNKLVFVQPGSAAAKKLEMEVADKEEEIVKLENNEELFEQNMEYNSMEEQMSKGKKPRGSRYRGVSRNGNQWQVLIMVNKKKRYVGSYSNEEEAARAYDKVALQNHGAKAKTNFDYLEEEVQKILSDPPLLKLTV